MLMFGACTWLLWCIVIPYWLMIYGEKDDGSHFMNIHYHHPHVVMRSIGRWMVRKRVVGGVGWARIIQCSYNIVRAHRSTSSWDRKAHKFELRSPPPPPQFLIYRNWLMLTIIATQYVTCKGLYTYCNVHVHVCMLTVHIILSRLNWFTDEIHIMPYGIAMITWQSI